MEENKFLLIDLENCPNQILQLQKNIEEYTQIIICYAKTGVKIPLDWLVSLSTALNNSKLKVFKMTNGGKNSADFGICFFAGRLMQQFSEQSHFIIVSNDTDLDHVVDLLISQGATAERVGLIKKENIIASDNLQLPPMQLYCGYLIKNSKNRPLTSNTLLNSIKSILNNHPEASKVIFNALIQKKAFIIFEKKVSYNDKKINEIAKTIIST
jgi:hypothetical protein